MALNHEWMFYEVMHRAAATGNPMPLAWWVPQAFRRFSDSFDGGLFPSKEAAFASNAHYRYWNMIGVKDHHQESLVGQAGEIEPVYDQYALSFLLFDPAARTLHLPQHAERGGGGLEQRLEDGYLPTVITTFRTPLGITVEQRALATTVDPGQRSVVVVRLRARLSGVAAARAWLCVAVSPWGPTGFQRHDAASGYRADRRLTFLRYLPAERRVLVNASWGPMFEPAPASFGTYGNGGDSNPDHYLAHNPYADLLKHGALNGWEVATDHVAGLCTAVFAWPVDLGAAQPEVELTVKLPVDDYRGADDVTALHAADPAALDAANRAFWTAKLDASGLQADLPAPARPLLDLYRTCRANLLMLSDDGQIHPGPTIYDSFWVRDSAIEGVACALAGDVNLARRQFGQHYLTVFNRGAGTIGPARLHGFFGGEHEKDSHEWDSNGQALWAIGRLDRILGGAAGFGAGLFSQVVLDGARWIRDNRSPFGLLHSGWSAEHIGGKGEPHYWDDLWGLAGLWEAARLGERIGAPAADVREIWWAWDALRDATRDSIRWVLREQRARGMWETFIPTGPADVGRLDSTIVGAVAYFHPTRLYMGQKLGSDIDSAARHTLETIWSHFVTGGFRHESAWACYGPYLTLQIAHAFLLAGDLARMEACLAWSMAAGYAEVSRAGGGPDRWQVVLGAWNEQHCYPIASDFAEVPDRWWYMGDIPHGWACAELMLLLRDMLFFEADEDGAPHLYVAPGVLPRWLDGGATIRVVDAPTILGRPFGFELSHQPAARRVTLEITQSPGPSVGLVYPCRLGSGVQSAEADGQPVAVSGRDVRLPPGTQHAVVSYRV